jgi:hypothetical protein
VLLGVFADAIAERGDVFTEAAGCLTRAEAAGKEEAGEEKKEMFHCGAKLPE